MEKINIKCSSQEHSEIDAKVYCQECKIYMCNKCLNYHTVLFKNHHQNNLSKDFQNIFIDICKEENHKLEFFCKKHNQLCCVACISKIREKGYGQHKDCEICTIENIKEEKKKSLKENIKYLENLSNNFVNSFKEIKMLFENMNKNKEELKLKIQQTFTRIRNAINEREDELLSEIDKKYSEMLGNEDFFKESEKLPNEIKILLERGKLIDNEFNDNDKLSSIIKDCIHIENIIKNINIIMNNIKKFHLNSKKKLEFCSEKDSIDNFLQKIKTLGNITSQNDLDSLILKNEGDLNKFKALTSNLIKLNNIKLIYRLTKDGFNYESLVNKINNKFNLIFLFCAGNQRIFGAFIKTKLENIQSNVYFKDENSFVFSLNNNKIYKILIPDKAIKFNRTKNIIKIGNDDNSNGFFTFEKTVNDFGLLRKSKIFDFQKNNELTEGLNELTDL